MRTTPNVSVIIPTLRRPKLVLRAISSVFNQTYLDLELIVVVDGPDQETVAALGSVDDPRLRVIVNQRSLTAAGARNAGVAEAAGEWIAFLDDDDEWLPQKLERQVALADGRTSVFVTCRSRVITSTATYVWPVEIYDNIMPLDEYLFVRRTIFAGSAFLQTSSFFLPRTLYLRAPFRTDTPHDDWDFVIRLSKQEGARIETVPEVLVNLYFEEDRPSLTKTSSWTASLDWLDRARPMLTPRGYSSICLGIVGPRAANERAFEAFFLLLYRSFRNGAPRPLQLLTYLAFWAVPMQRRRQLRAYFASQPAA